MSNINCIGYWEPCSKECGDGTQKFKVITPKQGNGTSCEAADGHSISCKKKDCAVDCVGDWLPCSKPCGSGIQTFHESIPKQGDGTSCKDTKGASHGETRSCNTQECSVNCTGEWEPCSKECGDGTQKFKVITPKQGNGTNCEAVDGHSISCKKANCPFCTESCRTGYTKKGQFCSLNCPPGYRDNGIMCIMDAHVYSRGGCCNSWQSQTNCISCPSGYTQLPCHCSRNIQTIHKQTYTPLLFQSNNITCPENSIQN